MSIDALACFNVEHPVVQPQFVEQWPARQFLTPLALCCAPASRSVLKRKRRDSGETD